MHQLKDAEWDRLVGRIYDTALDPSIWGDVILEAGRSINAHAGQLVSLSPSGNRTFDNVLVGEMDVERAVGEFTELIAQGQHVRAQCATASPELAVFTDADHTTPQERRSLPFYQEHVNPLGIPYYGATVVESSEDAFVVAVLLRSERFGQFDPTEVDYLQRLGPHIRRSLELHKRLPAQAAIQGIESILAAMNCGALIVDRNQRIHLANDRAVKMLSKSDCISDAGSQLSIKNLQSDRALKRQLKVIFEGSASWLLSGSGRISLGQTPRGRIEAVVIPLRALQQPFSSPMCLVLLIDPEKPLDVPGIFVRRYFGLSPSEHEIVLLLCKGQSVNEIANARGTSLATARSQLKSIYAKTGVSRQSELVAKIAGIASISLVDP